MRGRRLERAARRHVLAAGMRTALLFGLANVVLVGSARAQTLERITDVLPAGAVKTVFPYQATGHYQDLADALQGQVPGLVVNRYNNTIQIVIRASLECQGGMSGDSPPNPLLIVDGVPLPRGSASMELGSLRPENVARVDVLRDIASTSMYGMSGACGVLLIYTRKN